ncbi:hypothetical protein M23134_01825 [Microscilla marina ATCC 23134]|uniref:Uncharacterized protein n=1 Tax=Microscilla marina ATCC 23134 TaxID=313606 RepID=A1ZBZ4_MICM2|nr:hypothetical protein M23134_01825 [Microscilla marina ATCC 23134]
MGMDARRSLKPKYTNTRNIVSKSFMKFRLSIAQVTLR